MGSCYTSLGLRGSAEHRSTLPHMGPLQGSLHWPGRGFAAPTLRVLSFRTPRCSSSGKKKPHWGMWAPNLKTGINEALQMGKTGNKAERCERICSGLWGASARTRKWAQVTQASSHMAGLQDFIIPLDHFCYVFPTFLPPLQSQESI